MDGLSDIRGRELGEGEEVEIPSQEKSVRIGLMSGDYISRKASRGKLESTHAGIKPFPFPGKWMQLPSSPSFC